MCGRQYKISIFVGLSITSVDLKIIVNQLLHAKHVRDLSLTSACTILVRSRYILGI